MLIGSCVLLALVALVTLAGLALSYGPPALDARAQARWLAAELDSIELADINAAHLAELRGHLDRLTTDLALIEHLLRSDPLAGLWRSMDPNGLVGQLDHLVAAGSNMAQAAHIGLDIGDRFVALRADGASGPGGSLLSGLVGLMANSTDETNRIHELVGSARGSLDAMPGDPPGALRDLAALMANSIARYSPVLDQYRTVAGPLPAILGWQGHKRYLVLAQNPAELRPTGGYIGTVGVVGFQDGELTERSFHDVYYFDLRPGVPFVEPPEELANHLLGTSSWQLADANWSPDFPTSAQRALQAYTAESGDSNIDGVIALTTYALDRILEVTGPVDVPEYDVTVQAGEVTLTTLSQTRGVSDGVTDRKAFLNQLAGVVIDRLYALPTEQWPGLLEAFQDIADQRLMLTWFKDPAAQALVADGVMGGAMRVDAGDYLYVVEANVAPTSKFNLVIGRQDQLAVQLSTTGDATNTLQLAWQNDAASPGEPYESLRAYSTSQGGLYGAFVRVFMPATSLLHSATGMALDPVTRPEITGAEVSRAMVGNYLLMAPGASQLSYTWTTPGVATSAEGEWTYALTVQKQPGLRPTPLSIAVTLPRGAIVDDVSAGANTNANLVTLSVTPTSDVRLVVHYRLP